MRRALIAAALVLAAPGTAVAAPFGELPFRPVSGAATCLRATGAPGELVRWVRDGAEVLEARPDGLVPVTTVGLGKLRDCPSAAADAGGAGIVAGPTASGIRIALREPGGAWGEPITIGASLAGGVEVAISARGDAVVTWLESASLETARVRVARRSAGGSFGAPEQIGAPVEYEQLSAAVAGNGEAFVAITDEHGLRLASARPDAPFGPARQMVEDRFFSGEPALAVAPDGRALAGDDDDGRLGPVRARTGRRLRPPAGDPGGELVGLDRARAARRGRRWSPGSPPARRPVLAMVRDGVAPFGAPVLVFRDEPKPNASGLLAFGVGVADEGPPRGGSDAPACRTGSRRPRAARVGDGGPRDPRGDRHVCRPHRPPPARQPGPRPAGVTPLLLGGGARAIAWSDGNGIFSTPPYAGRLHLAIEGVAEAPAAAAPELVVGTPRDRTLRPSQALVLPVSCRAACDIHASIVRQTAEPTLSLARAGTALLRFAPSFRALASPRGTPIRSCCAGARRAHAKRGNGPSPCACAACPRRRFRGSRSCASAGSRAGSSTCAGAPTSRCTTRTST